MHIFKENGGDLLIAQPVLLPPHSALPHASHLPRRFTRSSEGNDDRSGTVQGFPPGLPAACCIVHCQSTFYD